ncbi:excinuclease ABC subunit C [Bacillus thuringiensis]|nr:excinuclease ABC subunit C [Bacillus thuringiensis]MBJ7955895.1 excinuclease ABC subunit C [Bacillus cereus]OTY73781.1 excinuclease ABC subunit C [Bacillus thuringiensis serovar canadensis]OUA51892.1 excinuclease ABC subunit C [Bacillus thuringiensis serovar bolivia]OUA74304.1 excinuclease ABC subunit C [Bacillus thuringiensis serovar pahangi]OUB48654.1 excinuclease ABC subunit C [Bacillus thuringiensis serovar iberica]QGY36029.1 excinuclease ABC subunit C [Bacillus sp. A260]
MLIVFIPVALSLIVIIIIIKEHRNKFPIPHNYKRTIKHQDIMYALSGKKNLST